MQFLLLFWEYFQIGLFTIGGGYAMLPMVQQIVERNGWMTQTELIGFVVAVNIILKRSAEEFSSADLLI